MTDFTARDKALIGACAKVLDNMHVKIVDGWDHYSDERADGAHNALTNGAKAIRSLTPADVSLPEEDARDAERYRYLRNSSTATNEPLFCIFRAAYSHFWGESADQLIDAAIAASKERG